MSITDLRSISEGAYYRQNSSLNGQHTTDMRHCSLKDGEFASVSSNDNVKIMHVQHLFVQIPLVYISRVNFLNEYVSNECTMLGISETLHHSMSALHVKSVPLLDVKQLLMLFAGAFSSIALFIIWYNYYYYYHLAVVLAQK